MSPVFLSIIIPCYNEERRIGDTLRKVDHFLQNQHFLSEVIIVDDGSRDQTQALVQKFIEEKPSFRLIKNEVNLGKGGSVKKGMLLARGEVRLFSDADLSTPIEEIIGFLKLVKEFDVVIGSRRVKGADVRVRQPILREGAGRIFSLLVRLLTLRGFIDTQCGFKMFTSQAAVDIFSRQTINRFGFDVEILYIAVRRLNLKVKEAPVQWFDSPFTRVRLFQDSLNMFMDLLRIRLNDWAGTYSKNR